MYLSMLLKHGDMGWWYKIETTKENIGKYSDRMVISKIESP